MLALIFKKMQNAVYSRFVMNWKANRKCDVLESKMEGGGVAFLQDAKLKEEQRQRAEEAQIRAERREREREGEARCRSAAHAPN